MYIKPACYGILTAYSCHRSVVHYITRSIYICEHEKAAPVELSLPKTTLHCSLHEHSLPSVWSIVFATLTMAASSLAMASLLQAVLVLFLAVSHGESSWNPASVRTTLSSPRTYVLSFYIYSSCVASGREGEDTYVQHCMHGEFSLAKGEALPMSESLSAGGFFN